MEWSCPCHPLCWVHNQTCHIGLAWLHTHIMGMGLTQHPESSLPVSEIVDLSLFDFVLFLHSSTFNWTNPKLNIFLIPSQLPHRFSPPASYLLTYNLASLSGPNNTRARAQLTLSLIKQFRSNRQTLH